jgi:hypothetical protein
MNNYNNNIFPIPSATIVGDIGFVFLTLVAVALLITGLVYIINVAKDCVWNTGYFEAFIDTTSAVKERLTKIKQLNSALDDAIEIFNSNVQDSCEVYARVEDVYVGNNSSPKDDEFDLPDAELKARLERRKNAAKSRFRDARTLYGTSINTPIYECFVGGEADDTETELRSELQELETKLQAIQMGDIGMKSNSVDGLLKFNNKYIKKSLEEMGNERAKRIEGFADPGLSGQALLDRADKTIIRGNNVYAFITNQRQRVETQQELAKEMSQTVNRIQSGNISTSDIK